VTISVIRNVAQEDSISTGHNDKRLRLKRQIGGIQPRLGTRLKHPHQINVGSRRHAHKVLTVMPKSNMIAPILYVQTD